MSKATARRACIVGLAGGSASGKTTIADELETQLCDLRVTTMHMDSYFLRVKPAMVAPYTGEVFEDHNHPASFDLGAMVSDLDALASTGHWDVIIVEGLLTLQHEPLRQRLDLRLFVDAHSDERIVRRVRRSMARGASYDDTTRFYLQSVRYRHDEFVEPSRWHADLILNGAYPSQRGLAAVEGWIRSWVARGEGDE